MPLQNAIFPKKILEYHTRFSQPELVQKLEEHIEPKRIVRRVDIPLEHKKFEGTIEQGSFDISNVPNEHTYHACQIVGEIYPEGKGSRVVLEMRSPKSYVYAYLFFPVLLALIIGLFPFSKVDPTQVNSVYFSFAFGIVFVLAFPFFIANNVKKVQAEMGIFFDNLFEVKNHNAPNFINEH